MIFGEISAMIKKDLKIFFRSKASAMFVILIPLLIVLLAGYSFNSSNLNNVEVGVFTNLDSEFSNNIIANFEENNFIPINYDSIDSCISSVKSGDTEICVIFPDNLGENSTDEDIIFYVDYSRMNLADTLVNEVKSSVSSEASDIGVVAVNDLIDIINSAGISANENNDEIRDAVNIANENSDEISNMDFSTSKISQAIADLTDLKNEMNETSEIDTIILSLQEIEEDMDELSSNVDSAKTTQEDMASKLNSLAFKISNLTEILNSKEIKSVDKIVNPIKTKILPINPNSTSKDYLIPTILSLIIMFGSILIASTFVLKSKKTLAFFRNFMTPVNSAVFIFSTYLTSLFILLTQFTLVFVGIKYILKMNVFSMPLEIFTILFISLSAFIFIGMFIGYLFKSEEAIIFSSMIISTLLMFFSNIILPLENISSNLMRFAQLNPLVIVNSAMKKILLFNLGFSSVELDILFLGIFAIVFFVLSLIFRNLNKRVL